MHSEISQDKLHFMQPPFHQIMEVWRSWVDLFFMEENIFQMHPTHPTERKYTFLVSTPSASLGVPMCIALNVTPLKLKNWPPNCFASQTRSIYKCFYILSVIVIYSIHYAPLFSNKNRAKTYRTCFKRSLNWSSTLNLVFILFAFFSSNPHYLLLLCSFSYCWSFMLEADLKTKVSYDITE